jgi:hypothetical protein
MSLIASVDIGTLLGCQIALTLVYAVVFCSMKIIYPYLRGAGSVAFAFFLATIGNVLLLFSGSIPNFLSIAVSHCLLLSAFVLFYTGVLHFFKSPRRIRYAWALTIVGSTLTIVGSTLTIYLISPTTAPPPSLTSSPSASSSSAALSRSRSSVRQPTESF